MSDDGADDPLAPVRLTLVGADFVEPQPGGGVGDAGKGDGGSGSALDLPDACPVTALGKDGEYYFYLDANRQLREVKAKDHSRLGVLSLFDRESDWLYQTWPRLKADKNAPGGFIVTGWKPELASEALMQACARSGIWDVFERVRGAGAWRDDRDCLVLHVGDAILLGPAPGEGPVGPAGPIWKEPGQLGRYVYPAGAAQPRPENDPSGTGETPGAAALELFKTWSWTRGDVDAHLLLGHLCAAMVGGALDWRPVAWLTGGAGSGKSTLLKALDRLHGGALVTVSDGTAAGVWQKLGHSPLPVILDEAEAEEDPRQLNKLVKLARQAASGGLVLRGGADHRGSEFVARSVFLFSSILMPPLLPQDLSRLAVLELGQLKGGTPPPLDRARLGRLGAGLRQRMLDGWGRFDETLTAYRDVLLSAGHSARGADQFGTLLACADLALFNHLPDVETLEEWSDVLAAGGLAEIQAVSSDCDALIGHLMSSLPDIFRGGRKHTVAFFVSCAADLMDRDYSAEIFSPGDANAILQTIGLKVDAGADGKKFLAIAGGHGGFAALVSGTHWQSRAGASSPAMQSLKRIPGAANSRLRFDGVAARCLTVPLDAVLPPDTVPGTKTVSRAD